MELLAWPPTTFSHWTGHDEPPCLTTSACFLRHWERWTALRDHLIFFLTVPGTLNRLAWQHHPFSHWTRNDGRPYVTTSSIFYLHWAHWTALRDRIILFLTEPGTMKRLVWPPHPFSHCTGHIETTCVTASSFFPLHRAHWSFCSTASSFYSQNRTRWASLRDLLSAFHTKPRPMNSYHSLFPIFHPITCKNHLKPPPSISHVITYFSFPLLIYKHIKFR